MFDLELSFQFNSIQQGKSLNEQNDLQALVGPTREKLVKQPLAELSPGNQLFMFKPPSSFKISSRVIWLTLIQMFIRVFVAQF